MGQKTDINRSYKDNWFSAQDGLRIYYRDYQSPLSLLTPVLCLSGLTRNSIDFHELSSVALADRRVVSLDYRGRGRSEWDPNKWNYRPEQYIQDISHLMTVTGCHRWIIIGTSLGGLIAMGLAVFHPTALAGVVLNDIGPEICRLGSTRISKRLGEKIGPFSQSEAIHWLKSNFEYSLPDLNEADWISEVKKAFRKDDNGQYLQNFDPAIASAVLNQIKMDNNLWPYFCALSNVPALAIRGERSDLLSISTFEEMRVRKPDLLQVRVPNRGHTPLLNETSCLKSIKQFISKNG